MIRRLIVEQVAYEQALQSITADSRRMELDRTPRTRSNPVLDKKGRGTLILLRRPQKSNEYAKIPQGQSGQQEVKATRSVAPWFAVDINRCRRLVSMYLSARMPYYPQRINMDKISSNDAKKASSHFYNKVFQEVNRTCIYQCISRYLYFSIHLSVTFVLYVSLKITYIGSFIRYEKYDSHRIILKYSYSTNIYTHTHVYTYAHTIY